jgi:glycosyltransferase involved in cell wall biosynthesis
MKIVCITKNKPTLNWHETWKNALCKHAEVYFCGKRYPVCSPINKKIEEIHPDCLLVCGLPTKDYMYEDFSSLNVFKVLILFDYAIFHEGSEQFKQYGRHYKEFDSFIERNRFDLVFAQNSITKNDMHWHSNVKIMKLSFSPDFFFDRKLVRDYDVICSGSTNPRFYPHRKELHRFLKDIKELKSLTKILKFEAFAEYLSRSKIFVNSGNNLVNDCVTIKYLENMASGTLLITTLPRSVEDYGFKDGEHFISYSSLDNLKEKIFYYLSNENKRLEITRKSMEYVNNNFTHDIIIKDLLRDIEECKGS